MQRAITKNKPKQSRPDSYWIKEKPQKRGFGPSYNRNKKGNTGGNYRTTAKTGESNTSGRTYGMTSAGAGRGMASENRSPFGASHTMTRMNRRPSNRPASNRPARRRPNYGEKIDFNRMIQKSQPVERKEAIIKHQFSDFSFVEPLKANLRKRNFVAPTPIQDQAIESILEGRDLVGLASTGTGKTAAFLLPLINKVFQNKSEKVLIITPTRELAMQIENEFRQFSWDMKIFSGIAVGGCPIYKQIGNLKRNPNVVIGTPGRLKDLSNRGVLKFENFKNIVIDEVDRMMDMGFIDDIKEILSTIPKERQSLFFSATLPPKIKELISQFSNNPIYVEIAVGEVTKNVDQDIIRVRDRAMKFHQLQDLLSQEGVDKALIFIETKMEVDRVTNNLISEGFKADSIHGDKKQHQRQRALKSFQSNLTNILVATDVAARGLDIKGITHVINYTTPQTYDDYVHRIGRAGRGNAKGFAYTFVE